MTIKMDLENSLRELAPILNSLPHLADAPHHYDSITESIYCKDEIPHFHEVTGNTRSYLIAVRPLLRYRASLMLGAPSYELESHWHPARLLCADWPGFRPERLSPPSEVIGELRQQVKATEAAIARMIANIPRRTTRSKRGRS